jgi:GlpG protein
VIFGLFGYVWMKSRYQPEAGFVVPPILVLFIIGYFLLCFTGLLGPIANVAHAAGLGLGMLIGAARPMWRSLWRPDQNRDG